MSILWPVVFGVLLIVAVGISLCTLYTHKKIRNDPHLESAGLHKLSFLSTLTASITLIIVLITFGYDKYDDHRKREDARESRIAALQMELIADSTKCNLIPTMDFRDEYSNKSRRFDVTVKENILTTGDLRLNDLALLGRAMDIMKDINHILDVAREKYLSGFGGGGSGGGSTGHYPTSAKEEFINLTKILFF